MNLRTQSDVVLEYDESECGYDDVKERTTPRGKADRLRLKNVGERRRGRRVTERKTAACLAMHFKALVGP